MRAQTRAWLKGTKGFFNLPGEYERPNLHLIQYMQCRMVEFAALPDPGGLRDQDYDMMADWQIISDEEAIYHKRNERKH